MVTKLVNLISREILVTECMEKEEEEIFLFGLECMILKFFNYISYIIIGVVTNSLINLFVTACVFLPLRSRAGGYHAKTRLRCYLISCSIVLVICVLNRITLPVWLNMGCLMISNVIIWLFVPVENSNRLLDEYEKRVFRRQSLIILLLSDLVIVFMLFVYRDVSDSLSLGIVVVAFLVMIGKIKNRYFEVRR